MGSLTDMDRYLFDLNGYLVLRQAIEPGHLAELNASLDTMLDMQPGDWRGHVHGHFFGDPSEGMNLQQIYEAGQPWQDLIDHPAWYEHVLAFIGGQDSFDRHHGPVFIDENFASLRGPGEAIGVHSGPIPWAKRTQYLFKNNSFHCGQINILMALNDIGPGDGATMVIPASHKSNIAHPELAQYRMAGGASGDGMTGAIEVHLQAGDVLLFVDALMHGSAKRVNAGQRRIAVYRYGPSWGYFRHGYRPSADLLGRLSEQQRAIVQPHGSEVHPPIAQ